MILIYYMKLHKYIHFLSLYLKFFDNSKCILTDWITQWNNSLCSRAHYSSLDFMALWMRVLFSFWQNTDNVKSHIDNTTIYSVKLYITHSASLSFCIICEKPFAKLLKLHCNHQCNNASIYLTSTCLRRLMSRFYKLLGWSPEANTAYTA